MNRPDRPIASISLDLDDLWTYLRTHGDSTWSTRPSFLDSLVPELLDVLDAAGVSLTFFIVGSDAAQPRNGPLLRAIVDRGHELGNHSFEHEPWFHRFSPARVVSEVMRTHGALAQATGQPPVGFRGPGYSWSTDLLETLVDHDYLYDASTLPTYLGPLARAYYFWSSGLAREDRRTRSALFGSFQDGTRPIRAYRWRLPTGRALLEIPVTTFPLVKVPFHLTYIHYLSRVSETVAVGYLKAALGACRLGGISPSFILHPLDLLSGDRVPQLAFFPGMGIPGPRKAAMFRRVLGVYQSAFSLVRMCVHARHLTSEARLTVRRPRSLQLPTGAGEG